jgi:hypothetical protein
MMMIYDHCHLLSFIGATKAKKKTHKDNDLCCHLLCLRGARTRGGEDNNDM